MNKPITSMERDGSTTVKLLLDYPAAAEALSMSRGALRDLVYKGRGPVVTKIGNRTFFAIKDLERFVEDHRQGPVG